MSKWSHASQFLRDYKVVVADTPNLRRSVYQIRHHVYCQELEFESGCAEFPSQEFDEFDDRSVHCLVMHRASQEYIGCVRIVLSNHSPQQNCDLPFRKFLSEDSSVIESARKANLNRPMLEISRLAIKAEFRKHLAARYSNYNAVDDHKEPIHWLDHQKLKFDRLLVSTSLYFVCALITDALQVDSAFAMMEQRLARHLRYAGIRCHKVSPFLEHKGSRALFSICKRSAFENLPSEGAIFIRNLAFEIAPSLVRRFSELKINQGAIQPINDTNYLPQFTLSA